MPVRARSRSEAYVECFYVKKMTLADIARQFGVSKVAVREAIIKYDYNAYLKEKEARKLEREKNRRKRELKKRKEQRRIKRQQKEEEKRKKQEQRRQEYVQEEREAYEWLLRHQRKIFPFVKKSKLSDPDFVWFSCVQTGPRNLLTDPTTTNDLKQAIKNAYRPSFTPVEVCCSSKDLPPNGSFKKGRGGGRSSNSIRISMLS
ncbi:MAG: hypothetical protein GX088_01285 [Clostridia bacterium]|nr:hypothetical protein [Clostridia bacterium]